MQFDKAKIFCADFETTVYKGQEYTEVWAAAIVELGIHDVHVMNSIESFFDYVFSIHHNCIIYFHNLKFDGSFILPYLMESRGFTQALIGDEYIKNEKEMPSKSFHPIISHKGQWYSIILKHGRYIYEIRDSLKLLPFSVAEIGKGFNTPHKKSLIEYKGERHAGGIITEEERQYIINDIMVPCEALEIMFQRGHKKLTIGSCCMAEYKNTLKTKSAYDYDEISPDLYEFAAPEWTGFDNADAFIRKSYRGGYCYVNPKIAGKVVHNGCVADFNSLYPSVMAAMGFKYPIGEPYWIEGSPTDKQWEMLESDNRYYFIHIRCRFYLKCGMLPTIQIKGNPLYRSTEWLETSDIFIDGKYYKFYEDITGEVKSTAVDLFLTKYDYKLFLEHYETEELHIYGLCWFYAMDGIYDDYIDKYREIKENAKGAERTLAKLYSNNLYGQEAKSKDSSYKIPYTEDGILKFNTVHAEEKIPGYIARGSAITSYARYTEINFLQANYQYFLYADTDSGHFNCCPKDIKGVKLHPTHYGCAKIEVEWDSAIFARQKTYVEHVIREDGEDVEPYHKITCAGMGKIPKKVLSYAFDGVLPTTWDGLNNECKRFLYHHYQNPIQYEQFYAQKLPPIPGQLRPKRIPGGIILEDGEYIMH